MCKGQCVAYMVKKPASGGRYEAGQAWCSVCSVWIDHRGAHLRDGSPAMANAKGWSCNCCKCNVRRTPKNGGHKPRAQQSGVAAGDLPVISHFDKRRAYMLRMLGSAMAKAARGAAPDGRLLSDRDVAEMEAEFETSIEELTELALSYEPNKASLIAEVELLKSLIGAVPTMEEIGAASRFTVAQYEAEFETWGHMLDRLGYDPWYRDRKGARVRELVTGRYPPAADGLDELNARIARSLEIIKSAPGKKGCTAADLMAAMRIGEEEMQTLVHRLARIDGITLNADRVHIENTILRYDGDGAVEAP